MEGIVVEGRERQDINYKEDEGLVASETTVARCGCTVAERVAASKYAISDGSDP